MRNKNIGTDKRVPKAIRREIYREAIKIIERGKPIAKLSSFCLCLLLPSILWKLDSFLDNNLQGKGWDQWDTSRMFPELTEERIKSITKLTVNQEGRDIQRIKVLDKMLAEVQPIKKEKQCKEK